MPKAPTPTTWKPREGEIEEGLRRLDRLAQRKDDGVRWLRRALEGRLERCALPAVQVTIEGGGPIADLLARRIEEGAPPDLVDRLLERCQAGRDVDSLAIHRIAVVAARRWLEILEERGGEHPDSESLSERAAMFNDLAGWLAGLGELDEAAALLREAVRLEKSVAADPSADQRLLHPASTRRNLAQVLAALEQWEEAERQAQKALELFGASDRDPGDPPAEGAGFLFVAARCAREIGDGARAFRLAAKAVDLLRWKGDGSAEWRADLAVALEEKALAAGALDRHAEALEWMEEAVSGNQRLAAERPDVHRRGLAIALHNLSSLRMESGDEAGAVQAAREMVEVYRSLSEDHPGALEHELAEAHDHLSELSRAAGSSD